MFDLGLTRVFTWSADASDKLALTPYRQAGRPSRFEFNFDLGLPLAEGVATPRLSFIPAAEVVLSLNAGFRYLFYWGQFSGMSFGDGAKAVFSPVFTDQEIQNLDGDRLPAMQIDRGRYNLLAGLSADVYFHSGAFFSPRVMVVVPVLGGLAKSGLGWWFEMSLSLGWMF
jgi:hypothetical protein